METLRKINLMRQRMQVLKSEEESTIIGGGGTIDDWISGLQKAGFSVNVYSDPNDIPEDLLKEIGSYSWASGSWVGSGTADNPYLLDEVTVTASHLQGSLLHLYHFDSLADYVDHAFNTAWYDSVAKEVLSSIPGIGMYEDYLQNGQAQCLEGILKAGYDNNSEIYVSMRFKENNGHGLPATEVRAYDAITGELIYTTGWR